MQTLDHDSASIHVDAPAREIYQLVTDITRTPEFSPEILRSSWLDGATGPVVGARFAAVNKVPRRPSWTNKPVVTVVEPDTAFAFARTEKFAGTVEWTYRFEPDGEGTLVTESYRVTRPISRVGWFIIGTVCARHDRRADLRNGMEQTLQRLRDAAERTHNGRPTDRSTQSP
jgi:Polyketide cyclase / dehydrase and lipid transport